MNKKRAEDGEIIVSDAKHHLMQSTSEQICTKIKLGASMRKNRGDFGGNDT